MENQGRDKHWLLSSRASRIFLVSVISVAAGFLYFYGLELVEHVLGRELIPASIPALVGFVAASMMVGIGSFVIWAGMLWYLFLFDESSWKWKGIWFLILLLTLYVGATAYYVMRYRRDPRLSGQQQVT